VTGRREWLALGAVVLLSTAFRAWAAVSVPVPWIAPDEMVYGLLGRSLYLHGSLTILGGPTPFYSLLVPTLVGFPLSAFGLVTGLDVLQGFQAFVMSLAAVPVYLWGRSLVSRWWALVAAALAVAVPGLAYSGLMMSEVLFYPLLVLAAWALAEAIARPTPLAQGLLVVAVLAVCATRVQAIVLLPVAVTAVLVDGWLGRSWANLRRLMPAAIILGGLAVIWIGYRLGSGKGTLGGYEVITTTSWSIGAAAKYVVYHLASVLILCGLFPLAAVAVLFVRAVRDGEQDPRARTYLAVASSLTVWLVVEVGVFTSYYSDRIVERNLIALGPVLFIGLVLWIDRGGPGSLLERGLVAGVAAVVLVVLPVRRLVNDFGTHDALTMVPLYKLVQKSSPGTMLAVYLVVGLAAAVAFALLPRGAVRFVPAVLAVAAIGASAVAGKYVVDQAALQQRTFLDDKPRWIDRKTDGPVAYLYDGEPSWNGVWETLFWNEHADRVYDLSSKKVPGPLPQAHTEIQPDGTVFVPPSARRPGKYAVASTWITLVGDKVKTLKQQGLTQAGLKLWQIEPPLRVRDQVSGLALNGDINGGNTGRLDSYDCTNGLFKVTLIVKEPQTIDIKLGDQVLKHLEFPSPKPEESWHGEFPVSGRGHDLCSFQVSPTGLLGTTVFEFDRGS
jgi:hypothetical protein